ncbi:hypothetical protein Poly30_49980 [Planctomycetes bacterium Poly30]|uniref:Uncharacterized protein n=1 Tax=Saltatorellus ferox TaxID=2528018 RepID=A0A518EZB5_9BACT|nr:hypothetical protein Poly30_49980 [Planctomycetes bacterium Poly30]
MLHLFGAPLIASLLFAGPAVPAANVQVVEAAAPVPPVIPTYSISALLYQPERKLGEEHRVFAQLHGEIDDWHPFLTRFHSGDYRCLTFWADEQWLWIKEEFDAPAVDFFVRRGSEVDRRLRQCRKHDRLQLDLEVREVHAGRTWIEITGATLTEAQTPEGTILHAIRALDMIEREGWALAASELERALKPDLPGHVRRELRTILEQCRAAAAR